MHGMRGGVRTAAPRPKSSGKTALLSDPDAHGDGLPRVSALWRPSGPEAVSPSIRGRISIQALEFCLVRIASRREAARGKLRRPIRFAACCFFTLAVTVSAFPLQPGTLQMARASISSTEADWKATPHFSYTEREVDEKGGVSSSRTYRVCMIAGSPYSRLIAAGGEPLSPAEQAREGEKLRQEITRRANESPQARAKRVAQYQEGRERMFALLNEMAEAFDFKQGGQQEVDGHEAYVLQATPRPGYEPKSRETKLLTGMSGKLWMLRPDDNVPFCPD